MMRGVAKHGIDWPSVGSPQQRAGNMTCVCTAQIFDDDSLPFKKALGEGDMPDSRLLLRRLTHCTDIIVPAPGMLPKRKKYAPKPKAATSSSSSSSNSNSSPAKAKSSSSSAAAAASPARHALAQTLPHSPQLAGDVDSPYNSPSRAPHLGLDSPSGSGGSGAAELVFHHSPLLASQLQLNHAAGLSPSYYASALDPAQLALASAQTDSPDRLQRVMMHSQQPSSVPSSPVRSLPGVPDSSGFAHSPSRPGGSNSSSSAHAAAAAAAAAAAQLNTNSPSKNVADPATQAFLHQLLAHQPPPDDDLGDDFDEDMSPAD